MYDLGLAFTKLSAIHGRFYSDPGGHLYVHLQKRYINQLEVDQSSSANIWHYIIMFINTNVIFIMVTLLWCF